jgi:hypothetical protein
MTTSTIACGEGVTVRGKRSMKFQNKGHDFRRTISGNPYPQNGGS